MQGYATKNAMECYTTENLVKADFTLHRSGIKKCTKSWKIIF